MSKLLPITAQHSPSLTQTNQSGTALVVVLIMLVVASLLGISAAQLTLQAERSTRYDRDYQIAFQAAEAALLDAEFDIRGPNASSASRTSTFSANALEKFVDGCGTSSTDRGLCLPTPSGKPIWLIVDFTDTSSSSPTVKLGEFTGRSYPYSEGDSFRSLKPELAPRYIIEAIEDKTTGSSASSKRYLHRITAIGFGPTKDTQVVLQSVFRKESS
jgi:type IV pilus assembly protein PilX